MKVPTAFVTTLGGDHVPVYGVALVDGFCKSGGASFIHNGLITLNVGVSFGRMVTLSVAVVAQKLGAGVKVYVWIPATFEEIVDGDQVPVIGGLLVELVSKPGTAPF